MGKPVVRVLIVTDDWEGQVNGGFLQWVDQAAPAKTDDALSRQFHLGEFVRVLTETNWLGFDVEITKAHRGLPANAANTSQFKQDRGADVIGFRFDQVFQAGGQSRQLSDYDVILFFPISPGTTLAQEALQHEAEAIAQFMENGGGFFATGDHEDLGAPLCKFIPRVRSMWRWAWSDTGPNGEPIAPPALGSDRHDTTRPGPDNVVQFEDQSDDIAQEINPTFYAGGFAVKGGYPASVRYPHPLLCSPDGVVSLLPDHMHEGWCEVPDNLAGRTFKIGNQTNLPEYPVHTPQNAPLAPEVVATGTVIGGHPTPSIDDEHADDPDATIARTFGVIGAWDGHLVNKGRVVVDATWHHFFNINLTGDMFLADDGLPADDQRNFGFFVWDPALQKRVPNDHYRMIMWYYRNIVYWLIPAERMQSIWWFTLIQFARRPRLGEELRTWRDVRDLDLYTFNRFFYFGQLAEEYLRGARGACASYLIHRYLYKPKIPPWEWVQEIINIWDPAARERDPALARMRLAGVMGAGPAVEVLLTTMLGCAVVTAAQVRSEARTLSKERLSEKLMKLFPTVLQHGLKQLHNQLQLGRETLELLEKTVSAPVGEPSRKGSGM